MGNELAIHSTSERVQYIGLVLHISPDEVQTLLDLSKMYDQIYYEYIAAMMCGVIRYGNIMFPNYYWKRSHIRERIEKCTEEFEYDGVYRYVNQWTIQYVLQSAYMLFVQIILTQIILGNTGHSSEAISLRRTKS